jgi:hypothetical protein
MTDFRKILFAVALALAIDQTMFAQASPMRPVAAKPPGTTDALERSIADAELQFVKAQLAVANQAIAIANDADVMRARLAALDAGAKLQDLRRAEKAKAAEKAKEKKE